MEQETGLHQNLEWAHKEYAETIERRLRLLRLQSPLDDRFRMWEELWELEKEYARKEERMTHFGLNVAFVDRADLEDFKELRASIGIPPLSPEQKAAIQKVMSQSENAGSKEEPAPIIPASESDVIVDQW